MRKHFLFLSALILVVATAIAQQPAKMNVAVSDLQGKGIDASTAGIISERLRAEMVNTGAFRVMERAQMEIILKEQGFQKTGACDEASCLVQVGQLLGVDRMVAGSIGQIGSLYTISLRMLNVATGEILFTISEDFEGTVKDLLSKATASAAYKLGTGAGGEIRKATMIGKTGDLYIASSPSGAAIEIDGKAVPGETPVTLKGIAAGEHTIAVRFVRENDFACPGFGTHG